VGTLTTNTFDYASVDKDTKGMLISFAGQFAKQVQYHAASGMEAGKIIDGAHELFAKAGCEGKFSEWVESELKVSRQTAYNYMWAWQRFGNCKTIYNLDAGAMYKLAAPTVPAAAAKEAIKLSEKGQRIDSAKAKELLEKFKELVKPKPTTKPRFTSPHDPATADFGEAAPVEANECAPGKHKWGDDGNCERCYVAKATAEPPKPNGKAHPTFDTAAMDAASEVAAKEDQTDSLNGIVPDDLLDVFSQCRKWQQAMSFVSSAKKTVTEFKDHRAAMFLDFQELDRLLSQARVNLKFAMPYTECPKCRRKLDKKCPHCKGQGWLNKATFTACASDADKGWLENRK
jgi:hypothetical protein